MPPVASEITATTYAGISRTSSRLRGYYVEEGNMGATEDSVGYDLRVLRTRRAGQYPNRNSPVGARPPLRPAG